MYGLVNKAVQDLIVTKFGQEKWIEIKEEAAIDVETFVSMDSYPDEVTYKLVGAASVVLGIPAETILETFGEYWTEFTAKEGYGEVFSLAGNTFLEFIQNLDNLHSRVGLSFPKLEPPRFHCSDITEDSLRLHYYSDRDGLAPMVSGLIRGLAKHFETEVHASLDKSRANGDDHDEFLIRFGAP